MYYIIVGETLHIAQVNKPAQAKLQALANQFDEHIYVIEGQHAGLSARPNKRPSAAQRAELSIVSDNALL